MMGIWRILVMKILLLASCCGLPAYELPPRPLLDEKETQLMPIIASPCTFNSRCWGWLPTTPRRGQNNGLQVENYRLQDDSNSSAFARNSNAEENPTQGTVKSPISRPVAMEIRSGSPVVRQVFNKPVKKDIFVSRTLGAGGMPFSVLYMNRHGTRLSHPSTSDNRRTSNSSLKKSTVAPPTPKQQNTRVAPRNGSSPPRRYSIIPQLFISYGWGPFGK
ncbi:uncharacterized protein LOC135165020 [Diachasmimorpha longicaudata]|uniref:uncharacterized protein LOC135165020 n=1 Tax=Diachasmimorpha longicaudata TaxID=58733 RepID=UPI0030B8B118